MTNRSCPRESAVVVALRNSTFDDKLLDHITVCRICSEVLLVARYIRHDIASSAQVHPPNATLIWRRAQEQAKEKAVATATVPIQIARYCSLAAAIFGVWWLLFRLFSSTSWLPDLALRHLGTIIRDWSPTFTGAILIAIMSSVICITLSSWYLLRYE